MLLVTGKEMTVTIDGLDKDGNVVVIPGENVALQAVVKGNAGSPYPRNTTAVHLIARTLALTEN